jgi:hypothetical protein
MNVYLLDADVNNFQNLELENINDDELLEKFDGTPLSNYWKPLAVRILYLYDDEEDKSRPASDTPGLASHIPVFSERAVRSLNDLLRPYGEFLPLKCNQGKYFAFNVTCVIDALDEDKSDIVRFDTGRILDIKKYVFNMDKIGSIPIFKLQQIPLVRVFVTDGFARQIEAAGLTGFSLKLL